MFLDFFSTDRIVNWSEFMENFDRMLAIFFFCQFEGIVITDGAGRLTLVKVPTGNVSLPLALCRPALAVLHSVPSRTSQGRSMK